MADFNSYYSSIYILAEGTNFVPNDYKGLGTKCGVSAELYKDATGKTLTEAQLRAASCDMLKAAVKWVWDKLKCGQIDNQQVANCIADHAENKGWVRMSYMIQYILNDEYGAQLAEDGVVGLRTVGAINAAVNKNGWENVYGKIREYRRRFYLGEAPYQKSGRRFADGYANTQLGGVLLASRLDRYFPVVAGGGGSPYQGNGTDVMGDGGTQPISQTDINVEATKASLFKPQSLTDYVFLVVGVLVIIYLIKTMFKGQTLPPMGSTRAR
jgi:lysozyme family protein